MKKSTPKPPEIFSRDDQFCENNRTIIREVILDNSIYQDCKGTDGMQLCDGVDFELNLSIAENNSEFEVTLSTDGGGGKKLKFEDPLSFRHIPHGSAALELRYLLQCPLKNASEAVIRVAEAIIAPQTKLTIAVGDYDLTFTLKCQWQETICRCDHQELEGILIVPDPMDPDVVLGTSSI